jgi:hypothetical protein
VLRSSLSPALPPLTVCSVRLLRSHLSWSIPCDFAPPLVATLLVLLTILLAWLIAFLNIHSDQSFSLYGGAIIFFHVFSHPGITLVPGVPVLHQCLLSLL